MPPQNKKTEVTSVRNFFFDEAVLKYFVTKKF